jgi:hypothetical protein
LTRAVTLSFSVETTLRRILFPCLLLVVVSLLAGCRRPLGPGAGGGPARSTGASSTARFTDVTEAAGIRFTHTVGRSGRLYLPETLGSGCAFLDFNNDGKLDLFLVNSTGLPGFTGKGPFYPALYRNDGGTATKPWSCRFTDVTRAAGLAIDCYGLGVAVADYDGDGFADLLLTAVGSSHLFRNDGNGTFTEVTQRARVGRPGFWTSAAWFDYDRDGKLDLFVGNYCRWSPELNKVCPDALGRKHMCGPSYYQGLPSALYHNNGDGTFTEVTKKAGVYDTAGKTLGVVVWDADGDGWPDLLVAKDMEPNLLFRNNRDGTFTERGVEAGIAYSPEGRTRAGMGIDTGDTANDGHESILVGNNTAQGLAQFLEDDKGHFTDVAQQTGLYEPSLAFLTFGLAFVDYDGDGFKDIIAANGHIDEQIHLTAAGISYPEKLAAFHNEGGGQFREAGAALGPVFQEQRVWRGLAVGDFDNDGDPDLLVSTCGGRPALLRNEGGNQHGWLQVALRGAGGNRQGLGSKITVTAGGVKQTGWVRSGSSYCSSSEALACFGLGGAKQADTVELRWPSGIRQTLRDVKADQVLVVTEQAH